MVQFYELEFNVNNGTFDKSLSAINIERTFPSQLCDKDYFGNYTTKIDPEVLSLYFRCPFKNISMRVKGSSTSGQNFWTGIRVMPCEQKQLEMLHPGKSLKC